MEPYGELVTSIVRDHFGDIVEAVCATLLNKGTLTLPELCRHCSGLERPRIQDALVVLIQHNLVEYESRLQLKTGATTIHYTVNSGNVVLRLRQALFVRTAKDIYGETGEEIAKQLFLRGRSAVGPLIAAVSKAADEKVGDVREVFTTMVQEHFLIQVFPPKSVTVKPDGKTEENDTEGFNPYALKPTAATGGGRKRANEDGDSGRGSKRRALQNGDVEHINGAGEEDDILADFADAEDGTLWRVHTDQVHALLRNKDIVKCIQERIDEKAADIVRVILKLKEQDPPRRHVGRTSDVPLSQIYKALRDPSLNEQDLHYHLLMLCELSDGIVVRSEESQGGKYCIDVGRAADVLRSRVLESIVKERLGSHCCRMYRMVAKHQNLEERQLAEMAMIEFKEARQLMNKMITSGVLEIQEVPKNANRIPSATFFLLSHNKVRCVDKMRFTLLSTLNKTMSRRRSTIGRHTKFLDKIERQLGSTVARGYDREFLLLYTDVDNWQLEQRNQLSEADQSSVSKLHNTIKKLTAALLLVDQSLMVLQDY